MNSIFQAKNAEPQIPWHKFTEVGEQLAGELMSFEFIPAKGTFKEQVKLTLKLEDGSMRHLALQNTSYMKERLVNLHEGEIIGIELERLIPNKGFPPTKQMKIFREFN